MRTRHAVRSLCMALSTALLLVLHGGGCFFSSAPARAAFPAPYYPRGEHPRLWLTPERMAAFQQARQQRTQPWLAFETLCNSLIDGNSSTDPYNLDEAPQHYIAPLALMFRITGIPLYADKALELMDLTPLHFLYAEPDHENYQYMGLGYDWLVGYNGMTEEKRLFYLQKIRAISDFFWNENQSASGTDSDKNLLIGAIHLILGAAIYGESADGSTLLDRGWHGWETGYFTSTGTSNRDLIAKALGGVYFTGIDYFNATDILGIAQHWLTMGTAFGYDLSTKEPDLNPFWANTIRSIIHLTEPNRASIYPYGSWQDANNLDGQSWMYRALAIASYFADQAGYTYEANLGRGYAEELDLGDHDAEFEEFFFHSPNKGSISPYSSTNALPLIRFANEPDFLLFRDTWAGDSTWGLFTGNGSIPFDHQSPDHGSFALWRGNQYLTKGARSYESGSNGDFFNTLSIENDCYYDIRSCSGTALFMSEKAASLSRHRGQNASPLFAYAMLEADGQWNELPTEYEPVANVQSYRRHFFWAGDYVVVFDRLRAKQKLWVKYRLRALTEPSINEDTVSQLSVNGQEKLLQRTLEPSGVSVAKINEQEEWADLADWVINASERHWQSVITLPSATRTNILNVIQMGPATMTGFDTLNRLKSNGSLGVRIGSWVICFAAEETLRTGTAYTISKSTPGMWHLVTDLEAGDYQVQVDNQVLTTVTVHDGDNTALFQTNTTADMIEIILGDGKSKEPDILSGVLLLLQED